MADSYENGYKVVVFQKGGSYNLFDMPSGTKHNDGGKTLAIFNTTEDVIITGANGRQFGPSVLAPFSCVALEGSAGYIHGCITAKSFGVCSSGVGNNAQSLQMWGNCYMGPISCKCTGPWPAQSLMKNQAAGRRRRRRSSPQAK